MSKWPLRYQLAYRAHCCVNRLYRAHGNRLTRWLNDRVASLWVDWWIYKR